jgi:hypothetical protein
MNDKSLEHFEQQIASLPPIGAPPALREMVLTDVQRELRASRWDRRLARAAVVLLAVGVGLNAAAGLQSANDVGNRLPIAAQASPRRSLVDTAVVVAEATDARTGRQFARQLAAMTGHTLTVDEAAAIDAAVGHAADTLEGKKG